MPTEFLFNGPDTARFTILLAHGAGGPMDSAGMTTAAANLAAVGFVSLALNSPTWRHEDRAAAENHRHERRP